jgi:hypothetical protein
MKKELIEELREKTAELSAWLQKNFDPYTVIVVTDTEVKIVRTESAAQFMRI